MKKIELSKLIERKKILKESLDIINEVHMNMDEVGGFDDPEIMSQYHGNYYDELAKTFIHFDGLADELISTMSKILDDEERQKSEEILKRFHSFMTLYRNLLIDGMKKLEYLQSKSSRTNLPGMENIGLNEDNY